MQTRYKYQVNDALKYAIRDLYLKIEDGMPIDFKLKTSGNGEIEIEFSSLLFESDLTLRENKKPLIF